MTKNVVQQILISIAIIALVVVVMDRTMAPSGGDQQLQQRAIRTKTIWSRAPTSAPSQQTIEETQPLVDHYSQLNLDDIYAIPRSDRSIRQAEKDYGRVFSKNNAVHIQHTWNKTLSTDSARLLFVHIGKSGGSSMRHLLTVACYSAGLLNQEHDTAEECVKHDVVNAHSVIDNATVSLQHGNYATGAATDWDNITGLLLSVRDPVDRFVSWFYHNLKDLPSHRTNWRVSFFDCFPGGVQDLAAILAATTPTNNATSDCRDMALRVLHGLGPPREINHMFHNLMWYTRQVAIKYEIVYVIRTLHLWDDFAAIDKLLGGGGDVSTTNHPDVHIDHGTVRNTSDDKVSASFMKNLCCTLVEELDAYRYLLNKATNEVSVAETMQLVWDKCQVSSMKELVNTCPEELLPIDYRI